MTVATILTLSRIFLVPIFLVVVLTTEEIPYRQTLAALVFTLAAATDGLDGYIARARREVTKFGTLMDPIADKILISSALIALVELDLISAWIAVIIIGREFAVSGLRLIAAKENVIIPASIGGKIKTFSQIVAIITLLLHLPGSIYLIWLSAFITIYSGIDYFLKAQKLFKRREE